MTDKRQPEIVLYDLACIKNVCFSPVVWRIRLMLNYKRIPYKTVFLEFQDIEPTLKALDLKPHESVSPGQPRYTVPAIHHIPTDKHIMDSAAIANFLESVYPDPSVLLSSQLGQEVESEARRVIGTVYKTSLTPRELHILSPPTQQYFRRTREASLGHPLEELVSGNKEEEVWNAASIDIRRVGEKLLTNEAKGPFLLGQKPSYTDFFIVGSLQCAKVNDEGVFEGDYRVSWLREDIQGLSAPYRAEEGLIGRGSLRRIGLSCR
ncbi:related to putative glutathione S-transferase [Ramularia collo-cygni]|uniref:Related to putative glutathione S-transferase n=1 Tax=Ramularia collo-cygni TaxID=112498 RepID=A0A2D3ULT8_9PEZI|nr:related to putative glutathione S-transferase [Ramularia collo-cygni]CZT15492.1 related to putative glutathione S-transferase [Ramularia collo-cygni]